MNRIEFINFSKKARTDTVSIAHGTAAFLTWHRYFIHLYESLLIDTCNYKGSLP